ncbi:MAG: XRE family transcriptional regulator [Bradyrhizobium sp.]|uniref:helix-turn-helix domain-containing protein n=1 Tax=Bradyrhizobium sp. TaxID=376 RepID=UPI001204ED63|nr:XRE family transcriptional regulator [Bradyrhizobium sp.]THD72738.1 MAG: XRE family transcriptional regulator [Bradyrhizobium sp.]
MRNASRGDTEPVVSGDADALAQIGRRLKGVRTQKQLTLKVVSDMTGVSISVLSKIENSQTSPSFDVIKRICDGLEISLEDFVKVGEKTTVSGRNAITRLGEAVRFASGQYEYQAHAMALTRKGMVPLEIIVRARFVDEFDHWSQHDGEEFVFVLAGEIEVHTEHYAPYRLKAGESGYFDSGMKHVYISLSRKHARVLSVSYDPQLGARQVDGFMNPATQRVDAGAQAIAGKVAPSDTTRQDKRKVRDPVQAASEGRPLPTRLRTATVVTPDTLRAMIRVRGR